MVKILDLSEPTLAEKVVPSLGQGMLCLAGRFFPSYRLWRMAAKTGAELLWRTRQNARLDVEKRLPDGSYLSRIYASTSDRRNRRNGIVVRVIDYCLQDVPGAEPLYRLITTILDHRQRTSSPVPRTMGNRDRSGRVENSSSRSSDRVAQQDGGLVQQELFGLLMAHFAISGLMHEAELKADEDPDQLSFLHSVRVVQRRMARYGATPPSAEESPA